MTTATPSTHQDRATATPSTPTGAAAAFRRETRRTAVALDPATRAAATGLMSRQLRTSRGGRTYLQLPGGEVLVLGTRKRTATVTGLRERWTGRGKYSTRKLMTEEVTAKYELPPTFQVMRSAGYGWVTEGECLDRTAALDLLLSLAVDIHLSTD